MLSFCLLLVLTFIYINQLMTQDLDMGHSFDTNGHANLVMVIESDMEKYNVLYGTNTKLGVEA